MAAERTHYTAVAIVLHWAIAAAILFNLPLGLWMHEQAEHGAVGPGVFAAFQLHKSIGLTVLALSLARLGWRLANPPPPLPAAMPAWERLVAKATHWAFYVLMIGLPISGWVFVSAGWSLHENRSLAMPTYWFGLIQAPALFNLPQASDAVRADVAGASFAAHAVMAWIALGLVALHVAAALKHHVINRDATLAHMIPGLRAPNGEAAPRHAGRLAVLGLGLSAVAVALVAGAFALGGFVNATAPQHASAIEIAAPAQQAPAQPAAPEMAAPAAPALPGAPAHWQVDAARSAIQFSYDYTDESGETRLNGRFARWRADIRFDAENLAASAATVTIEPGSAATSAALHDRTLAGPGWFDAGRFPTARFQTREIRRSGDGYEARGDLTIRDRTRDVRLPFTLTVEGQRAIMDGRLSIDRRDFDLGDGADGDDQIGRTVEIVVHVEAARAP